MKTQEVARLTQLSVRTLRYWENLGLLEPERDTANGYRQYSEQDLERLQQILFFRACGFPLAKIRTMLSDERTDRMEAFRLQQRYLLRERERIDTMLETLEKSMRALQGGYGMSNEERFRGFDMNVNPYEEEARDRWGDQAVDACDAHLAHNTDEERREIGRTMERMFAQLGKMVGTDPTSAPVQEKMDRLFRFFCEQVGYPKTAVQFGQLGQLYVTDERFSENIDRYGAGLSRFLSEAMATYADQKG